MIIVENITMLAARSLSPSMITLRIYELIAVGAAAITNMIIRSPPVKPDNTAKNITREGIIVVFNKAAKTAGFNFVPALLKLKDPPITISASGVEIVPRDSRGLSRRYGIFIFKSEKTIPDIIDIISGFFRTSISILFIFS